jgi:(methylthio)acryloyl-CoA hydratase
MAWEWHSWSNFRFCEHCHAYLFYVRPQTANVVLSLPLSFLNPSAKALDMTPQYITVERDGDVTTVTLAREAQRNAINEAMLTEIETVFRAPPEHTRCFVLAANGAHFCAGLDLREHHDKNRTPLEFMKLSLEWHKTFDHIQFGGIPVVAALQGAVVGGGLELAAATHVRIADPSTFFALPEGQRGIFTGGGATVRVGRIITPARMVDMMLSARTYDAQRGLDVGLAHEVVAAGEALARAKALAQQIATYPPMTNYAIVTGIARINDMSSTEGLFAENLLAAAVQANPDIQHRLGEFLNKKTKRLEPEK